MQPTHDRPLVNRGFGLTLLALVLAAELALRLVPGWDAGAFRVLYGNSLSIYMALHDRLSERASSVRWLALGDSLAMTQFEPEVFEQAAGLGPGSAFNASFLGMSFPSQRALLHAIGRDRLARLETVLYFVNPRRLSTLEVPNTEIFALGVPPPEGRIAEALSRRKIGPLLDASRLYGLSRHLLLNLPREALSRRDTWDQVERLRAQGGVAWAPGRETPDPPPYTYPPIPAISPERSEELVRVLALLESWGVRTWILRSPVHASVEPFASEEAERAFDAALRRAAAETGSRWLGALGADFAPPRDTDFTDYGHMNDSGARAYTEMLARDLPKRHDAPPAL